MQNIVNINGQNLLIKEFNGERVVTFDDIDRLHERPSGTARKRFNDNKDKFLHGQDYWILKKKALSDFRTNHPEEVSKYTSQLILITESGYLMLVKSLTDDLAWKVQRELVNNYFRVKEIAQPQSIEDLIILQAKSVKELKQRVNRQEEQIEAIKGAVLHPDEDWRNWVNEQLNKIAFKRGNYRELRKQTYDILENRARCRLNVRLNNLRDRLRESGATQTKINQANYLDVIEEDPRLKEIYTSIVEKLVIKYSA
ncbi:MAG: hypothetical protein PWR10_1822 [Halanaerobiales bacterium]|nr:hypothetical protein [Halanaerobiales bacterium]